MQELRPTSAKTRQLGSLRGGWPAKQLNSDFLRHLVGSEAAAHFSGICGT